MLGRLKDMFGSGVTAVQRASLLFHLTAHFEHLGTNRNPLPDAASRLANFVVDGDDRRVLQDLKTSNASRFVAFTVRDGSSTEQARSLNGLLKMLARDVDRLVRLAFAFEAAYGTHGFYGSPETVPTRSNLLTGKAQGREYSPLHLRSIEHLGSAGIGARDVRSHFWSPLSGR